MNKRIIACDLGATKCATALIEYDSNTQFFRCHPYHIVKLSACNSLDELIDSLEHAMNLSMSKVDAICIGAAGMYENGYLQLEPPYLYPMCFAEIAKKRDWPAMAVIHDYAPILCATFTSYMQQPDYVKYLNSCKIKTTGRRVALGIGTGLGLKDGILFEDGNFWLGNNEMGHIGVPFPPHVSSRYRERHCALIDFFQRHDILEPDQPLTFEKILSGKGMARLYQFCHPNSGAITPEDAGNKIAHKENCDVRALFAWYLGLFIGTVQLTFMPEGGIWITGGVVLNHLDLLQHAEFQHGIEASPTYIAKRLTFPLGVLCNSEAAFWGGAYYAIKRILLL